MKPYLFFFLAVIVMLSASCRSKKTLTEISTVKSDTLISKVEIIKAPLVNDVVTLREICKDSIATEFKRVFIRDTDTVTVEIADNSLSVHINQQEREISRLQEDYKSLLERYSELRKKTLSTPRWVKWIYFAMGFLICLVLYILFPGIFVMVRKWFT